MKLVNISNESYAASIGKHGEAGYNLEHIKAERAAILAALNTPLELGSALKVAYNDKVDRYVVTFGSDKKTASLKATPEVAEFVTAYLQQGGVSWQGRMQDGVLVDVNVIGV